MSKVQNVTFTSGKPGRGLVGVRGKCGQWAMSFCLTSLKRDLLWQPVHAYGYFPQLAWHISYHAGPSHTVIIDIDVYAPKKVMQRACTVIIE